MVCDILYNGKCLPQDTSLEVSLPCSLAPCLSRSILLRSLPPSRRPCLVPSLPRSFPSPISPLLPSSTDALCLSSIIASSLPPLAVSPSLPPSFPVFPPSPPSPSSLPPHPSSLPPSTPHLVHFLLKPPTLTCSLPPTLFPSSRLACSTLRACLPPAVQLNVNSVCVFGSLH